MKQAAEATDAGGSRVPQDTLHLRQKTGKQNEYNLMDFFFLLKYIFFIKELVETMSNTKIMTAQLHVDIFYYFFNTDNLYTVRLRSQLLNATLLFKVVNRKIVQCQTLG